MNKGLKIFLSLSICLIAIISTLIATFFIITSGAKLNPQKLIDYTKSVCIYDDEGNKLENTSAMTGKKSVCICNLNQHTIDAFIASEDRNFYKHNGLNYKRIIKATCKNIASMSFKEGASTISQQLIKNTHLSSDKTITRKLKEIRLTKQLEKKYSKDEILEMYLNTIYFGHNCYGLQKAAGYYFDVPAEELSIEQSATCAGLLASPNNYSPFKNPEKCIARRNTVLKSMYECSFIDGDTYEEQKQLPLSTSNNANANKNYDFLQAVYEQFESLEIDPYAHSDELKIYTYLDVNAQNIIEKLKFTNDGAVFIRNKEGGVCAYRSTIGDTCRQIGSTAKPLFVYAPAIEENKVNLFTKIDDEPINYNGYSPENYDKKYHGKVSVTDSIKYSYNVPAVKTLNTLDFKHVKSYAEKMNIPLSDDDLNLSLALGATREGITIKQLCDAYSTFQSGGKFTPSSFIKKITDKSGKVIYERKAVSNSVFSEGTCSLINDALCKTSKSGTAKKLNSLNFDIATKTGTCGNNEGNTDAYSISYTSDLCVGVWLGDKDNNRTDITGGRDCCAFAKEIFCELYKNKKCLPLEKDKGTITLEIDREDYESNAKILICDDNCPQINKLTVKCLESNKPTEKSVKFSKPTIKTPEITVKNSDVNIVLCQTKYYTYIVNRYKNGKKTEIYNGIWAEKIIDSPSDGEYKYSVIPYYKSGNNACYGEEIFLPKVKISAGNDKSDEMPEIIYKDWFNR